MKYLFSLVFLLSCLSSFAQEPAYTPMRLNYQFRGIKTDSLFLVPSYTDTTQANGYTVKNIGGALIRTGSDFWMRNGTATAWLQNVNVGPGASPVVQFVDSVWRVMGKDSIFWRKGGVTNKIKDSTGAPANVNLQQVTDNGNKTTNSIFLKNIIDSTEYSLNQILSTTGFSISADGQIYLGANYFWVQAVDSFYLFGQTKGNIYSDNINIESYDIKINSFDSIKLDAPYIKINTANRVKIGEIGTTSKTGNVLYNHAKNSANTNAGNFTAEIPGVYVITNASSGNNFVLPDAALFPGQMVIIVNEDGVDASGLSSSGGSIYDRGNSTTLTSLPATDMGTFFSNGINWYGYIQ